jgi:hypothetical protein
MNSGPQNQTTMKGRPGKETRKRLTKSMKPASGRIAGCLGIRNLNVSSDTSITSLIRCSISLLRYYPWASIVPSSGALGVIS